MPSAPTRGPVHLQTADPPRVPCSENSDPRIPCTSFHGNSRPPSLHCSASFFPAPSPCSPILSPEPGLQGGLAHPLGGWPVSPSSEEGHADIYQSKHQTVTPPHTLTLPQSQSARMTKPRGTTFKELWKALAGLYVCENKDEKKYSLLSPCG